MEVIHQYLVGIVTAAIIAVFVWLMHQTFYLAGPHCNLQLLYVPALDLHAPPPENTTTTTNPFLFFDLTLVNVVRNGIYYGDVNLTFYYGHSHKAVSNYTIPGFYQGWKKTARRRDMVETSGVPWRDAVEAVSTGSKVVFRMELAAKPRFKNLFTQTNPKNLNIVADVEVDGTGVNVVKEDIRLTSAAASFSNTCRISVYVAFIGVLIATYLM